MEVEVSPDAVLVGVGIDPESVRLVFGEEGVCASGWWSWGCERPDDAVAVTEANAALGIAFDRLAALVDNAMVLITEKREVFEARLAAMG